MCQQQQEPSPWSVTARNIIATLLTGASVLVAVAFFARGLAVLALGFSVFFGASFFVSVFLAGSAFLVVALALVAVVALVALEGTFLVVAAFLVVVDLALVSFSALGLASDLVSVAFFLGSAGFFNSLTREFLFPS